MKRIALRRTGTVTPQEPPSGSSASAVDLVQRVYEALRRQDLAAALGVLDPEVEVWQSETLPWGGTYRRHQGFADYSGLLVKHVEAALDFEAIVAADGDRAVATGRSRGRSWESGKRFDAPFVHLWTAGPNGLQRLEVHVDTALILAALET